MTSLSPTASLDVTRQEIAGPRRALAVFAVLSAMALVVLDAGIVNVALPSLGQSLDAAPAHTVLVVSAYQAGLVMALLPAGALGERFGHRRVFASGVAVFSVASALCAMAASLPWLVAARWIQGLGGAAVMALGVALLRFCVPPARLGAAIGWNALTVALASAAAPSLGAAILWAAGWPALFAVNLPLAAAALAASRALPATPQRAATADVSSMTLSALAFGLLILAAEAGPGASGLAWTLLAGGVLAFALLLRREAPKPDPLIPLDLLRAPAFRLSVVASVYCFAAQSAGLLALPYLLQHGFGLSPFAAGLCITVWPLSVATTATVAGRLSDRLPTAWLCAVGSLFLSLGLIGAALWPHHGQAWCLVPFLALSGLGFGLFQTPNNRCLFLAAPPERAGAAGGMQGSARVTGQTMGALTMSLLFSVTVPQTAPKLGLVLAGALALAASAVSLRRARP